MGDLFADAPDAPVLARGDDGEERAGACLKIALVSDAWQPQINGVVRTLNATVDRLRGRGHVVETITPDGFHTVPCPSYPEIRLAIGAGRRLAKRLDAVRPDIVHIATEGPLGWAARRWCLKQRMPFTTSFHTRFPDYVAMRTGLPAGWFWPLVRHFHGPAAAIFTSTETLARELGARGLPQTHRWSRGVDLTAFSPDLAGQASFAGLPGPIQLYVGRVAVEKNIEAFLETDVGGSKVVVGEGPARLMLQQRHPDVLFLGPLHGAALAASYASADVLVFPSRTDTFGLVMIEALASGTPVAAYPVQGPLDVIGRDAGGVEGRIGALHDDLAMAIRLALDADRMACLAAGRRYDWERCTDQFVGGLRTRARAEREAAARTIAALHDAGGPTKQANHLPAETLSLSHKRRSGSIMAVSRA